MLDLSTARWRKSSRSSNVANCVEVAFVGRAAGVRDSKNTAGPALVFADADLAAFLTAVKADRLGG